MNTGLSDLEKQILEWQAATFPQSTPQGVFNHLRREFIEVEDIFLLRVKGASIKKLSQELADIFILSVALANHLGFSMTDAIADKMTVNKLRKWQEPDKDGVIEHVRE